MEFNLNLVIISPFIKPNTMPKTSPDIRASQGFTFAYIIIIPDSIPHNVAILPTDRSNSPTSKSNDCAIPIIPIIAKSLSKD